MTDDLTAEIGLMQISVCVPDGSGSTEMETLVESIIGLFPMALLIPKSGMNVSITRTPYASPAQQEPGLYVVPVNIRYWATSAT